MRYRLRTLLIVLALGPPVLAGVWFAWPALRAQYVAWQWREVVERAKLVRTGGGGLVGEDKSADWPAMDASSGALPMVPVEKQPAADNDP
jgi:hypothetical protein